MTSRGRGGEGPGPARLRWRWPFDLAVLLIALAGIGLALFACAVSYIGHASCDTVCHTSLLEFSPLTALVGGMLGLGVIVGLLGRHRAVVVGTSSAVVVCWLLWLSNPGLGH